MRFTDIDVVADAAMPRDEIVLLTPEQAARLQGHQWWCAWVQLGHACYCQPVRQPTEDEA